MSNASWVALAALGLAALLLASLASKRRRLGERLSAPWPLEPRQHLLTERERSLFARLTRSLPEHRVLTQVQLLRILEFKRGQRTAALVNHISRLSIDFVIVNADTSIVAAVELDDTAHSQRDRPWVDARKTHALRSAGIPLIRWNAKALPDEGAIRAAVLGSRSTAAA